MAITTSKNQIFIIVCHLPLDSFKRASLAWTVNKRLLNTLTCSLHVTLEQAGKNIQYQTLQMNCREWGMLDCLITFKNNNYEKNYAVFCDLHLFIRIVGPWSQLRQPLMLKDLL